MNKSYNYFDVIIIGGGHAGSEAAFTSARLGAKTLLISINLDHIGQMSCNPAIGGIAKGHVVREIDALGGIMGRVTEASMIQFKMLNQGKGPAVWSPRAQCDKTAYQRVLKNELEKSENISIHQAMVESFIIENNKIIGVVTQFGEYFYAKAFVIASGTFLSGKLHYGLKTFSGGRAGDPASVSLSDALKDQLGLSLGRLKTGTPQRILSKSIDFSKMDRQDTELFEECFTFFDDKIYPSTERKDLPCYIVRTNKKTGEIVRKNLDKAPMYQGQIKGIGTRYCPSFEDKIVRFPHHEIHTLYLEPEGENTQEYYINGFSTSLPVEIQWEMLRSIDGLENALISRYAYAIEYDFVFPNQINRTLAVKKWENLFLAGQINGTSGYEEAAGQGLVAGLNAARYSVGKELIEIGRDISYIGVMIDDLVSKDIIEPYRLFTSRAEYRLHLRQDNADLRLSQFAFDLGLLPVAKYKQFKEYSDLLEITRNLCIETKYEGSAVKNLLKSYGGILPKNSLKFPSEIININMTNRLHIRVMRQLVIEFHYEGYLARELDEIKKLKNMENIKIPNNFDFRTVKGLSNEALNKLLKFNPTTFAQVARIDGVTPAELTILRVYLKRYFNK